MLLSRKIFTTCLALGLLALAPLGTVRADDSGAPKKGASASKLLDLVPGRGKGKGKEKTPLLRRLAEKRAKKSAQSAAQPTTQEASPK
jgi:hypothetical protein